MIVLVATGTLLGRSRASAASSLAFGGVYARGIRRPDKAGGGGERAFYSTAGATRALGVSRQRVHQLLSDGLIAGHKDPTSGRWRIDRQSVLSYARARAAAQHHPRLHALEAEVGQL
jgi:hypothetical protein